MFFLLDANLSRSARYLASVFSCLGEVRCGQFGGSRGRSLLLLILESVRKPYQVCASKALLTTSILAPIEKFALDSTGLARYASEGGGLLTLIIRTRPW